MTKHLIVALSGAIFVSGCAQVGQLTATDAMQAAAMASAFSKIDQGAAGRVSCYNALGLAGGNVGGATQPGILSLVEGTMEYQIAMQQPQCQAIAGWVLMQIARKTPFLGIAVP